MSRNVKISSGLVVVAALVLLVAASAGDNQDPPGEAEETSTQLVRSDSQYLSVGDSGVVFVEFLDFECEGCRAAYPAIEELRSTYGDRVSFVVRNFPLHNNSVAAASAAEAAAAQGKFEEMYHLLFTTQSEWGEKSTSQESVFFGFAEQLGLDMDQFEAVYNDPATVEKISRDKEDGVALGVQATPTFFLDGEKLEIRTFGELVERIEQAIGG